MDEPRITGLRAGIVPHRPDQDEAGRRLGGIKPQSERVEMAFDEALGRMLGGRLLTITTRPGDEREREKIWRALTKNTQGALAMSG